jgi:hypothetical protein
MLTRLSWVVFAVGVVTLATVLLMPRPKHYSVIPNTAHLLPSADPAHTYKSQKSEGHKGHHAPHSK